MGKDDWMFLAAVSMVCMLKEKTLIRGWAEMSRAYGPVSLRRGKGSTNPDAHQC